MEKSTSIRNGSYGILPASAPLANAFVPFQEMNAPRYEARKGLVRGTLYPGLELPFMGMVNQKEKQVTPTSELQALGFAIQELALYLDTHRDDKEALEVYQEYQKMYNHCREEFLKHHGPLNHFQEENSDKYNWVNDPWPWEYAKNREV